MADNLGFTPGTGKIIATDEVTDPVLGQAHVQFMKLMDGTLDGTNKAVVTDRGLQVEAFLADMVISLKQMLNLLARPIWLDEATGRLRVNLQTTGMASDALSTVTTVTGVTTVTTVSTVTSMSQLAGFSAKDTILNGIDRQLWYDGVRRQIQ